MVRKTAAIMVIPLLASAAGLVRNYTFTQPGIQDGRVCLEGCQTQPSNFEPSVAVKPVALLLPQGEQATGYSVEYSEQVDLPGNYHIAPFRPGGRVDIAPPPEYKTRSASIYAVNAYYPELVRGGQFNIQYQNGHAIFLTVVTPMQYNPVSGKVRYFRTIRVSVNTVKTRSDRIIKTNGLYRSLLKMNIDNKEYVDGLPESAVGADDYEYCIVTFNAIKDNFTQFIAFNKRRGFRTKVHTIETIKSTAPGQDTQEKLRNFITDHYTKFNIRFVLLAGDVEFIPVRGMYASFYDYGKDYYKRDNMAADMYYGCLDGSWYNSEKKLWGFPPAIDVLHEVWVSRWSVENATELNNMIQKTIRYSESPVKNQVTGCVLAGEFLWKAADNPSLSLYGDANMDEFIGSCDHNAYTTQGFTPDFTLTKLYSASGAWNGATFVNTINSKRPAWLDHLGHSNQYVVFGLFTPPAGNDVTDSKFTNNGTNANYFIAYTQGCYPGAFDNTVIGSGDIEQKSSYDCIGEYFTNKMANGAVAFISNVKYGLGPNGNEGVTGPNKYTDGSGQRFHRYFHDALFGAKIHFLEGMNHYSKEMNKTWVVEPDTTKKPYWGQMRWCAFELHVLGDPALSIWTNTPQNLVASHPTHITQEVFEWDTKMPFTSVALLDGNGDNIVASQITGVDGRCRFDAAHPGFIQYIQANAGGKMRIQVKAHNYLPYQGEITVSPTGIAFQGEVPDIRISMRSSPERDCIRYMVTRNGSAHAALYNGRGEVVRMIVTAERGTAGERTVTVPLAGLARGVYLCRLADGGEVHTGRIVITR